MVACGGSAVLRMSEAFVLGVYAEREAPQVRFLRVQSQGAMPTEGEWPSMHAALQC